MPNTSGEGYSSFDREFFSEVGKEGAIIDDRYNHGGDDVEYMIDYLRRTPLNFWYLREGQDLVSPLANIPGSKVMLINEMCGPSGEYLAWA